MKTRPVFRAVLWAVVGVVAMVYLLLGASTLAAIRSTQQDGSPTLKAIAAQQDDIKRGTDAAVSTNDQLLDCLDPKGKCYKRSQQQTGDVVGSINEITYFAVACADKRGTQSLEEIQGCVIQKLANSRSHPLR